MVPLESAKKFGIFPIGFEGKTLLMSMADPTDLKTLDDIGFSLGLRIKPILALESDIMRAIAVYYEGKGEVAPDCQQGKGSNDCKQGARCPEGKS